MSFRHPPHVAENLPLEYVGCAKMISSNDCVQIFWTTTVEGKGTGLHLPMDLMSYRVQFRERDSPVRSALKDRSREGEASASIGME